MRRPRFRFRQASAVAAISVALLGGEATPQGIEPARYAELLASSHAGEWICLQRPDRDDVADVHWAVGADGVSVVVSADLGDEAGESETYRYVTEKRQWLVHATSGGDRATTRDDAYEIEMHDVAAAPEDNGAPTFEGTLRIAAHRHSVRLREVVYFADDRWYQSRFVMAAGRWRAVERRPCGRLNPSS